MSNQNTKFQIYDIRCKDILDEDEIRFAGIINEAGNLIYGRWSIQRFFETIL